MMLSNVIVILCLFFAYSYAQQQAPAPEWIPGLLEDIAHTILLVTVKVADSDTTCFQTLQNLSYVNKQWHALVQPEENKVRQTLNEKYIQVHKRLGLALSEKFNLTPALAVALGSEVVEEQAKKFEKIFEKDAKKHNYKSKCIPMEYASSRWHPRCLGHAIRKNKKYIVKLLCQMKYMNINIKMDSERGEIPLLAGAILYNQDENDLDIIDFLLNIGANCGGFTLTVKEARSEANNTEERINRAKMQYAEIKEYTLLKLAQELNKPKIIAKLKEYYSEQSYKPLPISWYEKLLKISRQG